MNRNPILNFHDITIKFIGDCHLGKTFKKGVPLSKYGLREESLFIDLKNHLKEGNNCDYTIIIGDLFDTFKISNEVLIKTYHILLKHILSSKSHVILIPGNHDLSKDKSKISSYVILKEMLTSSIDNKSFTILLENSLLIDLPTLYLYLDCYDPFYKEHENKKELHFEELENNKPLLSIGHWDDPRFGMGYLPSDTLLKRSEKLVSGHIHSPGTFILEDSSWVHTGSMQPYTHAEDPEEEMYITFNYLEFENIIKSDIKIEELDLKNKNIRINCYPGYFFNYDIDCMSLVYNPILDYPEQIESKSEQDNNEDIEHLDLTDFNTMYLLKLKTNYQLEDNLLISINQFLKDDTINEFKL